MHGPQMTSIAKRFVILAAFLLAVTSHICAQTTSGTLLGLVRDKAGRGLSETKITIENEENGNRRATRTDERGNYTIFNLPPGTYGVSLLQDGAAIASGSVSVAPGRVSALDLRVPDRNAP